MEPVPDPEEARPAPIELAPSPREATIDLPSGAPEVVLTPGEVAASYDAAVKRGDTPGGAMDRHGRPDEPTGKGVAAYDTERGTSGKRRR